MFFQSVGIIDGTITRVIKVKYKNILCIRFADPWAVTSKLSFISLNKYEKSRKLFTFAKRYVRTTSNIANNLSDIDVIKINYRRSFRNIIFGIVPTTKQRISHMTPGLLGLCEKLVTGWKIEVSAFAIEYRIWISNATLCCETNVCTHQWRT